MTLAWSSPGCIEMQKEKNNEMEYEQNLGFGSMTLAWSSHGPMDALSNSKKNAERNLILRSMTLACSSLGCIETIQKKKTKWNTNKSDFWIHDFGMDLPWMH